MEKQSKKWWQSKTIWGVIVSAFCKTYMALAIILRPMGVCLPMLPAGAEAVILDLIMVVVGFLGDLLAIYGRLKAQQPIE